MTMLVVVFLGMTVTMLSCDGGDGAKDSDSTTTNSVPVAEAGISSTVIVGDIIQLDGSRSLDDDSDPLSFSWSFVSLPPGSAATLSDPTIARPTFTMDVTGNYELELVVNDGRANSIPDYIVLTTIPPAANAGIDKTVAADETVQLDGRGSCDADGDLLSFWWSFISLPVGSAATLSDPTIARPTFTIDVAGNYELEIVVNDGTADSIPDNVVITTEISTVPATKKELIMHFDSLDQAINNGQGYAEQTNECGTLAWGESYLLEAILDMYESTGEEKYLEKFVSQATNFAKTTDKARGIQDYKGRGRIGWSATKYYVDNVRMVDLVDTGMIVNPLLRFSWLVRSNHQLDSYSDLAENFISLSEAAVKEFESQWRFEEQTGEGWYVWESDAPVKPPVEYLIPHPMPINYLATFGKAFIWLYLLTGKSSYWNQAGAIATYFKNGLILFPNDSYVWSYAREILEQIEDISHGAIDVDFAVLAYRNNLVFDEIDITRFGHTFTKNICNNGSMTWYVDGSTEGASRFKDASGRWLELADYNCEIYNIIYQNLAEQSGQKHSQVLLGIAKLIKYYEKCGN